MRPLLFHFLGIPVPAWHFLFAAAALVAFFCFRISISKLQQGISKKAISGIFSAGYFGVIAGAVIWSEFIEAAGSHSGGQNMHLSMSSSGGIIGGVICASGAARYFRIPVARVGDAAALPVLLAFAIGRIGCFLNGDDYGSAISLGQRWLPALLFNHHESVVSRHPVQLYESACCLTGVFLIRTFRSRAALRGQALGCGVVGALSLVWYACVRFVLENLRGDWRGAPLHLSEKYLFSPPQALAVVMVLLGTILLLRLKLHE